LPWAAAAWVASEVAGVRVYNYQIKLFSNEIRDDWLAHERALDEDPRNGLPG
jgi:hypothetical protein